MPRPDPLTSFHTDGLLRGAGHGYSLKACQRSCGGRGGAPVGEANQASQVASSASSAAISRPVAASAPALSRGLAFPKTRRATSGRCRSCR